MSVGSTVEFANFTCRFGSKHVLLDYANEIVIPAFRAQDLKREYGDITYFLHDVELLNLGTQEKPVGALAGHIVKTTSVEREQTWENGKLVKDRKSLDSAPSALFVLLLNNHKLIYLPETKDAPSLEAFRALAQKFISEKYKLFQADRKRKLEKEGVKKTRKELAAELPAPNVEVIALSSRGSLTEFIQQFDMLNEIRVRLIDPNDELDNEELFDDLLQAKTSLGAKTTEVVHRSPDGLSKDNAVDQLSAIAQRGNTEIRVGGKDTTGGVMRGNNENFKLKVSIGLLSARLIEAAAKLHEAFCTVVNSGVLEVGVPVQDATEKVRRILDENA